MDFLHKTYYFDPSISAHDNKSFYDGSLPPPPVSWSKNACSTVDMPVLGFIGLSAPSNKKKIISKMQP